MLNSKPEPKFDVTSTNPKVWALEFCKQTPVADYEQMYGWFHLALRAGKIAGKNEGINSIRSKL